MTENEDIEDIEKILYMGVGRSGIDNENSKIAKALNELMQYRAIGTVEKVSKIKELYDKAKWLLDDERKKRRSYESIGTIEEFKALKEKEERFDRNIKMYNEIGLKIRAKAIDEFAEKIKKKGIEDSWNCNDFYGDSCGVTSCEECENDFLREIDEIAEQLKAGD
jgi:hypothetical protein